MEINAVPHSLECDDLIKQEEECIPCVSCVRLITFVWCKSWVVGVQPSVDTIGKGSPGHSSSALGRHVEDGAKRGDLPDHQHGQGDSWVQVGSTDPAKGHSQQGRRHASCQGTVDLHDALLGIGPRDGGHRAHDDHVEEGGHTFGED